ncbi:MAG: DapH/DapD/GlmU-related protein [Planctomycetaceae bacterium]
MKAFLKVTVRGLFAIIVSPVVLNFYVAAMVFGRQAAFRSASEFMSLLPGTLGGYLRFAFYRWVLQRCDDDACVCFGTVFSHPTIQLGRSVYVGNFCSIGDVTLEDDVLIASNVSIMNGSQQHGIQRLDIPVREQEGVFEPVTIGQDSWIGERAVVSANVGKHCVVGAGAVVTKPVPDYAIVVGVPARVIGDRRELSQGESAKLTADSVPENQ